MKDLVLLVADKNMHFALKGALARAEALEINRIELEFVVHPGRDGGVRKSGAQFLSLQRRRFEHALLLLDFDGSGTIHADALSLESELDAQLAVQWGQRAKAIAIEPELDVWVWGSDNAVQAAIGWSGAQGIREWLRATGFAFGANDKPLQPKEALEAALRTRNLPRSAAVYQRIAEKISLQRCNDQAFLRLRKQLTDWFPRSSR